MNDSSSSVGERLAKARMARGWSQSDLARACEMAATQVSRYEAGRATPRRMTLARFAMALAVRFQWLVAGTGEMDEYAQRSSGDWLTFSIDPEWSDRLRNYAAATGVSIEDALLDILDMPLSLFGPDDRVDPKHEADLKATDEKRMRTRALRGKVRVEQTRQTSTTMRPNPAQKDSLEPMASILRGKAKYEADLPTRKKK